jgi:hypothetical protein
MGTVIYRQLDQIETVRRRQNRLPHSGLRRRRFSMYQESGQDRERRQHHDSAHFVHDQRTGNQRAEQVGHHDGALDFDVLQPEYASVCD